MSQKHAPDREDLSPQARWVGNPMLTPFDEELIVGSRFAERYQILSVVGRGAMGIVYQARHELMGRVVAIKTLRGQLQTDERSMKRFEREARAASRMDHPNLISVHDFGIENRQPYLVMEFVKGQTLYEILKTRGRIDPDRAVHIFGQVCDALHHAHVQGVIHRDLKPANIMVIDKAEERDHVKVFDLGIAKIAFGEPLDREALTGTGEVCGSPVYLSPEQCTHEKLDHRSDIYALGVVMYELLTGVPPLMGETVYDTIYMHVHTTPPVFKEIIPHVYIPPRLERLIMKALEKNPNDRQQTMLELKYELQSCMQRADQGVQVLPPDALPSMKKQVLQNDERKASNVKEPGLYDAAVPFSPHAPAPTSGQSSGEMRNLSGPVRPHSGEFRNVPPYGESRNIPPLPGGPHSSENRVAPPQPGRSYSGELRNAPSQPNGPYSGETVHVEMPQPVAPRQSGENSSRRGSSSDYNGRRGAGNPISPPGADTQDILMRAPESALTKILRGTPLEPLSRVSPTKGVAITAVVTTSIFLAVFGIVNSFTRHDGGTPAPVENSENIGQANESGNRQSAPVARHAVQQLHGDNSSKKFVGISPKNTHAANARTSAEHLASDPAVRAAGTKGEKGSSHALLSRANAASERTSATTAAHAAKPENGEIAVESSTAASATKSGGGGNSFWSTFSFGQSSAPSYSARSADSAHDNQPVQSAMLRPKPAQSQGGHRAIAQSAPQDNGGWQSTAWQQPGNMQQPTNLAPEGEISPSTSGSMAVVPPASTLPHQKNAEAVRLLNEGHDILNQDPAGAIERLNASLAIDPGYAKAGVLLGVAHFNLGNRLAESNQRQQALDHYNQSVRLLVKWAGPNNAQTIQAKHQLEDYASQH